VVASNTGVSVSTFRCARRVRISIRSMDGAVPSVGTATIPMRVSAIGDQASKLNRPNRALIALDPFSLITLQASKTEAVK